MLKNALLAILVVLIASGLVANAAAVTIHQVELTASDGHASDGLGTVAISGNTAVVGDTFVGFGEYVFVKPASGWTNMTQIAKLTASDGANNGQSVSISGDTIIGCNGSSVYVFVKPAGGWHDMTETAKLTASNLDLLFPASVSGDTVVAGSLSSNNFQGAAYVFVKPASGWTSMTETAKLTASDGQSGDSLGRSVSVSGNTILTGANNANASYIFVRPQTGWASGTQTAKLTSTDGGGLGIFVAISGNTAVAIGNAGVLVYVKPQSGWKDSTETAKLTKLPSDYQAVAVSGKIILTGNGESANVYVEPAGGWKSTNQSNFKLTAPGSSGFGISVAISGTTGLVGAPYTTVGSNTQQGAAYVFFP